MPPFYEIGGDDTVTTVRNEKRGDGCDFLKRAGGVLQNHRHFSTLSKTSIISRNERRVKLSRAIHPMCAGQN